MAHYKVTHTVGSDADLDAIWDRITFKLCNPIAATNTIDTIDDAVDSLSFMPYRFPLVRDERLAAEGYRSLPVKNYTVFYTVNEANKIVHIQHVLYGGMDWAKIFNPCSIYTPPNPPARSGLPL